LQVPAPGEEGTGDEYCDVIDLLRSTPDKKERVEDLVAVHKRNREAVEVCLRELEEETLRLIR
jgi:hypothetical protein